MGKVILRSGFRGVIELKLSVVVLSWQGFLKPPDERSSDGYEKKSDGFKPPLLRNSDQRFPISVF